MKMFMMQQAIKKEFDKNLKKRFFNTYKFTNHDINHFILLWWKDVYRYEYMDDEYFSMWTKFNEILLPEKEEFNGHLNTEDITDADYAHAERFCKMFKIKNVGEYHDLCFQKDTLLLADVFEIFRNICLEMHELDPARFLTAPGLARQAALKEPKYKIRSDIDMFLMVKKKLSAEEYAKLFVDMQKTITNSWNIMVKIKNHCI